MCWNMNKPDGYPASMAVIKLACHASYEVCGLERNKAHAGCCRLMSAKQRFMPHMRCVDWKEIKHMLSAAG